MLPSEEENVFLPVHAYMFATAGAQIIEVVNMEEIAAEKQYEFAFLGFPLKLARSDRRTDAVVRGAAEGLDARCGACSPLDAAAVASAGSSMSSGRSAETSG